MNIKVNIVLICFMSQCLFVQPQDKDITVTAHGAFDFTESQNNVQFQISQSPQLSNPTFQSLYARVAALNTECYRLYGMNYNAFANMMNYKVDEFVSQLLCPGRFSKEIISALWQEYKLHGKQKKHKEIAWYQHKIKNELQRRANEKMQINPASQLRSSRAYPFRDLSVVQLNYQKYQVDLQDCPHQLFEVQYQQRQQAVAQTQQENYAQHDKKYDLDAQTAGYLSAHGVSIISFQTCTGTQLQHQFHQEICTHVQQVSKLARDVTSPQNVLLAAVHFADGACDSNKLEQLRFTSRLINTNCWLLEFAHQYVKAARICLPIMARAGVSSVTEFFYMFRHPHDTVDGLVGVICDLIELSVYNDLDAPEIFTDVRDEKKAQARAAIKNLCQSFVESTPEQKVETFSKVVADFCLPHKIMQGVGAVVGAVKTQARCMRTLEAVASCVSEELGAAEVAQEVALVAELEIAVQDNIAQKVASELMQAERHAPSAIGPIGRSLKSIMEETLQHTGIPVHRFDLYQEVKTKLEEIKQLVNKMLTEQFKEKYGKRVIRENGITKTIMMDLDHSLAFDYELKIRNKFKIYDVKLKIGHSSQLYQVLEEIGIVTLKDSKLFPSGILEYLTHNSFTSVVFPKTVFPKHWTLEKIAQAAWDVFENGESFITKSKPAKKLIVDGVEMSIILEPHQTGTNIVTILPYVEIKS